MKKSTLLLGICLSLTVITYGQKLSKKEARQILEKAWNCVKTSDTLGFVKLWIIDNKQWPYHAESFDAKQVELNFLGFKEFFDTALAKNMKFDEVECDTVEHIDPHYDFSKYYIKAWFKYNNNYRKGFGFYMDYINKQWLIRFSPDYSYESRSSK